MNQGGRGTRAENAVRDELGECGYDVIRSAASKGAADLVAVHDGEILFVQVKLVGVGRSYKQPSPVERRELVRIAARIGGVAVIAQRHPGAGARPGRTSWWEQTGPGPDDRCPWIPRNREREKMTDPVCTRCGGAGQVLDTQINEDGHVRVVTVTCPQCGGSGRQR